MNFLNFDYQNSEGTKATSSLLLKHAPEKRIIYVDTRLPHSTKIAEGISAIFSETIIEIVLSTIAIANICCN